MYDLSAGDKFEFAGRHRRKIFQIKERTAHQITYFDVATKVEKHTYSNREAFRWEVYKLGEPESTKFDSEDIELLIEALNQAYKLSAEACEPEERRSKINKVYKKVKQINVHS